MKKILLFIILIASVYRNYSQDSISLKIARFLGKQTRINGKIDIVKIKSPVSIEYYCFGKNTKMLIYYYREVRNKKEKFILSPERFYFSNNQLSYLYLFLGSVEINGKEKLKSKHLYKNALYEFENNRVKWKKENNIEPQNLDKYILQSSEIISKAISVYKN